MKPNFPFKNSLVNALRGFYLPDKICSYYEFIHEKSNQKVNSWTTMMKILDHYFHEFEEGLNQILYSGTPVIQVAFLEELKKEIQDFSLYHASESLLREQVDEYNAWMENQKNTFPEREYAPTLTFKDRKIHPFYELEILKTNFIPEYINILRGYMDKFRKIVEPYIKQYDKGKIPVNSISVINKGNRLVAIPCSFTFALRGSSNKSKLNDLHDKLRKHKFIHNASKVNQFKKIFSGEEIDSPVVWIGTASELHYFVLLIFQEAIVSEIKRNRWKVACCCFVNAKGEKYDSKKLKDLKHPKLNQKKLLEDLVRSITPH